MGLFKYLYAASHVYAKKKGGVILVLDVSFDDFTLRIASSIGELLLLLYKSGFYRRE